jgi:2-polyprenyl-6-methoxyphenol hydroxylase-like FAD-dependent oxidoreductase
VKDVLVVGGGPTGLSLASELRRHGVDCAIIERRTERDLHSKAISISASSLQAFDQMGVLGAFLRRGTQVKDIGVQVDGRRFFRLDYGRLRAAGVQHPFLLSVPQPECEQALEEHLNSLGGQLERGVALEGLQQHPGWVTVTLSDALGATREEDFRYVVGCDGSRSTVRRLAGIDVDGAPYDFSMIHGDFEMDWGGPKEAVHYFVTSKRFALTIPMSNGQHRVVAQIAGADPSVQFPAPTIGDFETLLDEAGAHGVRLREPRCVSHAKIYQVLARRYRARRLFLAGDACHLFSPIGGQGMNTGVQDAFNLAWKLAYVLQNVAPESLLESYELERRPIAAALLASGDATTQLLLGRAHSSQQLQTQLNQFAPRLKNRRFWQRAPFGFSGLAQEYAPSAFLGTTEADLPVRPGALVARAGTRAPDARLAGSARSAFDLYRGRKHVLLLFAPRSDDRRGLGFVDELWAALAVRRLSHLSVVAVGGAPFLRASDPQLELELLEGDEPELRARYQGTAGTLVLIRPDRYVELRTMLTRWQMVVDHLDGVYAQELRRSLSA